MRQLINKVENYCVQQQLLVCGGRVLAALSGGADSVCLVHMLKQLQPKWNLQLAAAHLHHGLRGADADADAAFARKLCQTLDIPFYEKKADVAAFARQQNCSVETAGRGLRYDFLEQTARNFAAETDAAADVRIATAHHKNDQAETVLMHMLRGSGSRGLAGIPPKRDNIIRPLLCLTREEIETYLQQNDISFRTDSTNLRSDVTRNRVRLELIPQLKRDYNPEIVETLCRTAEIMRQQQTDIDKQAQQFIQNHVKQEKNDRRVAAGELLAQGMTIGHAVLCHMAGSALEWGHVQAIWRILEKNETGCQMDLPHGMTATLSYGILTVGRRAKTISGFSYILRPGETCLLPELGYVAGVDWAAEQDKRQESVHIMPYHGEPIVIRSRQSGDRIRTGGRLQRVKQMMIDAKIPRELREKIPVVEVGGDIVWVYGLRHADTPHDGTPMIKIWIKEKSTCIRI